MPDFLPFDSRKDAACPSSAESLGVPLARKAQRPDPSRLFDKPARTSVPTNAYLVTVEILETTQHTYLVPAYSPEEAERLLARGRQNYEEVSSAPVGIESASVVNVEPVASSNPQYP